MIRRDGLEGQMDDRSISAERTHVTTEAAGGELSEVELDAVVGGLSATAALERAAALAAGRLG